MQYNQGGQQPGKPGNPGKVREFETCLENLEKSGNFIGGQGKFMSEICKCFMRLQNMANTCIVKKVKEITLFSSDSTIF